MKKNEASIGWGSEKENNMMKTTLTLLSLLALSTSSFASTEYPCDEGAKLKVVHTINDGEIAQAQLALQKAVHAEVRAYAEQMIAEHTANNALVEQLASELGLDLVESALSEAVRAEALAALEELAQLEGHAFDVAYMTIQVKMHQQALEMVTRFAVEANHPRLREFYESTAAAIQKHLIEAEAILSSLIAESKHAPKLSAL